MAIINVELTFSKFLKTEREGGRRRKINLTNGLYFVTQFVLLVNVENSLFTLGLRATYKVYGSFSMHADDLRTLSFRGMIEPPRWNTGI